MKDLLDETKLKAAFNVFDKDSKGFLTSACIREVLAKPGYDEKVDVALFQIMSQVKHRNGKISFEDFQQAIMGPEDIQCSQIDRCMSTTRQSSIRRSTRYLVSEEDNKVKTLELPEVTSSKSTHLVEDIVKTANALNGQRRSVRATNSFVHNHSLGYARNFSRGTCL
jgi:hypothetical protein